MNFKKFGFALVGIFLSLFITVAAFAQPAAKATAKASNIGVVVASDKNDAQGWFEIFKQDIKTPTGKDLFIDVSLECGLTTNTKVMSKELIRSLASAEAIVKIKVMVDEDEVVVNENENTEIIFARRYQELIAEFAGLYNLWDPDCVTVTTECINDDPATEGCQGTEVVTGISFSSDADCFYPESLQLILDTMQANSFNFIHPDLEAGLHTVKVLAKLEYNVDTSLGSLPGDLADEDYDYADLVNEAVATAYLGNGSVTIETVRMIKDEDVIEFD